jgi:hypothetical protein
MSCKSMNLIFLSLFLSTVAKAEDLMKTANIFAACSGKYAAVAEYAQEQKVQKELIEIYSGAANGAKMAAVVLIHKSKSEPKESSDYAAYVDSVANNSKLLLKARLVDPSASFETVMKENMEICTDMSDLQAEIVSEVRRQHYLNE